MARHGIVRSRATPAGDHVARAAWLKCRAFVERRDVAELLDDNSVDDSVPGALLRAASAPGTTADSGYLAELAVEALAAFVSTLPDAAAASLMRAAPAIPLAPNGTALIPVRTTAPRAPAWVVEGSPIAVRADGWNTVQLGPWRKIAAIAVITREAAKRADGEAALRLALQEDGAIGLDAAVFSDETGSGAAIAGLLNGATVVNGSGDSLRDIQALAAAVSAGGSGMVAYVAGPGTAAALNADAALAPQVLPSLAVPETMLIAIDPRSVAWAVGANELEIEVSNQAVLHMEDTTPAAIADSGSAAGGSVRSLWQTDCVAIRLDLPVAFAKRRAAAAAFIDHVDYLS